MKKIMLSLVVVVSLFSLSFSTFAHQYSNIDSYKWMVEDCRKIRIGLNAQGVSMNVDQVYTAKATDYRYYYYVISSGFINKEYVHVYSCRKNSNGSRVDLKAFDTLNYEYGDTQSIIEIKKNLADMKTKNLSIDYDILLNLRVDMGK